MLTVFNCLLIAYYDYGFTAATQMDSYPIPKWVFVVTGVNVFVAYTLDGIDGKQARRTGTSTPMGELFDHGLDSYSTLFICIYLFSLFGINDLPVMRMQFMTCCVYLNFYVSPLTLTAACGQITRTRVILAFALREVQHENHVHALGLW